MALDSRSYEPPGLKCRTAFCDVSAKRPCLSKKHNTVLKTANMGPNRISESKLKEQDARKVRETKELDSSRPVTAKLPMLCMQRQYLAGPTPTLQTGHWCCCSM